MEDSRRQSHQSKRNERYNRVKHKDEESKGGSFVKAGTDICKLSFYTIFKHLIEYGPLLL